MHGLLHPSAACYHVSVSNEEIHVVHNLPAPRESPDQFPIGRPALFVKRYRGREESNQPDREGIGANFYSPGRHSFPQLRVNHYSRPTYCRQYL